MNEERTILICEKRRYETEQEAQEQINYLLTKDDVKLRTYKCHTCHNWHLTSKPPR